jgi:TrmH family RNA methyltransferase
MSPRHGEVQRLRRLFSSRRIRREEKSFVIEGPELVVAALDAGWVIERAFTSPEIHHSEASQRAADRVRDEGIALSELEAGVLERVADATTPQPIAAVVKMKETSTASVLGGGIVVVLDNVRDPGNLGAVARVAEASGCSGLVLSGNVTDPLGPKALRASTGSLLRVGVLEYASFAEAGQALVDADISLIGTSSHAGVDFGSLVWPQRRGIVLGNEAQGLSDEAIAACASLVSIPLAAPVESLNVAVAAGILCFAAQRRLRSLDGGSAGSTMHGVGSGELG